MCRWLMWWHWLDMQGGAIYVKDGATTVRITGTVFARNEAETVRTTAHAPTARFSGLSSAHDTRAPPAGGAAHRHMCLEHGAYIAQCLYLLCRHVRTLVPRSMSRLADVAADRTAREVPPPAGQYGGAIQFSKGAKIWFTDTAFKWNYAGVFPSSPPFAPPHPHNPHIIRKRARSAYGGAKCAV